jgi:carbon-monoxide dehydrogenase medium subunit
MATYAEVERDPAVRAGWPLLAECAARVASPAIRSMGTVGGNLAYAEAASDLSPALLCLDAEVRIAGPSGERGLAVADLFRGFYDTALEPGEIITELRLPAMAPGMRGAYAKFCSRSADDKPLVGVAAIARLEGTPPRCEDIRIALAGVAPTPIRGRRAERAIRGEPLDDAAIAAAADAAAAEADPVSDLMGSAEYRRRMTRVWVRRVLAALRDRGERT